MTRTTDQAIDVAKEIASDINDLGAKKIWPVGLSVAGALIFAAGVAGLNGCISREDFLELAAYNFDNANQHRKRAAH